MGEDGRLPERIVSMRWPEFWIGAALALGAAAEAPAGGLILGVAADGAGPRLKALAAAHWDDELRANPLDATFYGDHRFDDRMPDPSEAAHEARAGRWRQRRAALDRIDPAGLSGDERMERELLRYVLDALLAREPFRRPLIPITHLEGLPLDFVANARYQPAATVGDLENDLTRLRSFPRAVAALVAVMRRGVAEGRVPPRVTMALVVPQLRGLAAPRAEDSPLWAIVDRLPEDWPEAQRREVVGRLREAIEREVTPAYARLADFVEGEYLPACRETVGLWDTPDGPAHYAQLIRWYTTTDLTPDEVHALGLAEVARAVAAMDAIRQKVGFAGDLKAFLAHLQADPRWRNTGEEAMLARYRAILRAMDAQLPRLFGRLPQAGYALHPVEAYRAGTASSGSYSSAAADGSRPAFFNVNTTGPEERLTYTMQALAYHEAVPGHHVQIGLAHEAPGRSAFRRHLEFAAFREGWGLYAEGLAGELGLYADPYAEFGRLEFDAWRSARLVVDTGLHHKRWTREQAVTYMEAITAEGRSRIGREVDRYIAWPGQAVAYKVGELKIRELRACWERRLGERFDLRSFHDRLLAQGDLPLGLLARWMEGAEGP
jgi:uncharacterized protein (DUF885 family)